MIPKDRKGNERSTNLTGTEPLVSNEQMCVGLGATYF